MHWLLIYILYIGNCLDFLLLSSCPHGKTEKCSCHFLRLTSYVFKSLSFLQNVMLTVFVFQIWSMYIGWIRTQKTDFGTTTNFQGKWMWRKHASRRPGFHQLYKENTNQYECEDQRNIKKQKTMKKLNLQFYLAPKVQFIQFSETVYFDESLYSWAVANWC